MAHNEKRFSSLPGRSEENTKEEKVGAANLGGTWMSLKVLSAIKCNCSWTEDELNRALGIAAFYGQDIEQFTIILHDELLKSKSKNKEISGNKKVTQSRENINHFIKDITA